jgi:hypothetical protein
MGNLIVAASKKAKKEESRGKSVLFSCRILTNDFIVLQNHRQPKNGKNL